MFRQHVTEYLSAYCQQELAAAEVLRVEEHLHACAQCREALAEIQLGIRLAAQLLIVPAPDSLWSEIQRQWHAPPPPVASFLIWKWAVAAAMILLLTVGSWYALRTARTPQIAERGGEPSPPVPPITPTATRATPTPSAPAKATVPSTPPRAKMTSTGDETGWEVARLSGTPTVGAALIVSKGKLAEGEWLETDNASRAQLKVAEIGFVDIDPNSRVKLVRTKKTEHRINLAQGKMSAFIVAPPRLFVVDTPSATAVDLGCAYTLEVDKQGNSLLHVTSGWVSLVRHGHEAVIPAGAMCATRKGIGVGTPFFADAAERFKAALARIDFERQSDVQALLGTLLAEARVQDSLTLWNLLGREFQADTTAIRGRLFDRLAELAPPPPGVTRTGVVEGERKMLELWWGEKIR